MRLSFAPSRRVFEARMSLVTLTGFYVYCMIGLSSRYLNSKLGGR